MNYQFKPSRTPTLPFNIYFASYLSCTFKPLLTGFLKATSTEWRQKRYTLLTEKITLQTVCLCHVAHRKRTISERKRLAISYVSIVYWKLRQNGSFAKGDDAKRAYFTMRTRGWNHGQEAKKTALEEVVSPITYGKECWCRCRSSELKENDFIAQLGPKQLAGKRNACNRDLLSGPKARTQQCSS